MPTGVEAPGVDPEVPGGTTVVVLPGLWMPTLVMLPISRRLEAYGWRVERFAYASLRVDLDTNAQLLAQFVARSGAGRVHLVGHSLGAIVAMRMLERHMDARIGRVVLLGPPYRDSLAARALASASYTAPLVGRSLGQWLQEPRTAVSLRVPVGVVAGTVPMGIGRLVVSLPPPSDGAVTVDETDVPGANDRILLPVTHSSMLLSARVAQQVDAFLRSGRFIRQGGNER